MHLCFTISHVFYFFRIDMYTDGVQDMSLTALAYMFQPKETKEQWLEDGIKKIGRRYLPVFEKVSKILYDFSSINAIFSVTLKNRNSTFSLKFYILLVAKFILPYCSISVTLVSLFFYCQVHPRCIACFIKYFSC